mgnify:CR=1 FL=1
MQMSLKKEFSIEGAVIPMSFIINNGDQDPAILLNGFGEGYGDTGDHFAVTDERKSYLIQPFRKDTKKE